MTPTDDTTIVKKPWLIDLSQEWTDFAVTVMNGALDRTHRERRPGTNSQRLGQATMNALGEVRGDLYHFATNSSWDPFYKDENLPEFWYKIYDQFILTMEET